MILAEVLDHLIASDYDRTCFAESVSAAMTEAMRHEAEGEDTPWSAIVLAACIDLKGAWLVKPHHDSTAR